MAALGIPKHSMPSDAMTVHGGGARGDGNTGITGSKRTYPKGSPPGNTDAAPFNPEKDPTSGSSIYVGGV